MIKKKVNNICTVIILIIFTTKKSFQFLLSVLYLTASWLPTGQTEGLGSKISCITPVSSRHCVLMFA